MAGTLTVDTIQSDSSYNSTLSIPSKVNFGAGLQVGGVDSSFGGHRNRLINGDMTIDQRNGGALVTAANTVTNYYAADKWLINRYGNQPSLTIQRVVDAPANTGFTLSDKITITTGTTDSTAGGEFAQVVEASNIRDFAWGTSVAKTITISFWVKCSVAATYILDIRSSADTRRYYTTYTINQANTWEYKTIIVPGDTGGSGVWVLSGTGRGLIIGFPTNWQGGTGTTTTNTWVTWGADTTRPAGTSVIGATTGLTWQITGVQLELGSSATPFEFRQVGTELLLCQRYYQQTWDGAGPPSGFTGLVHSSGYQAAALTTGTINFYYSFPCPMKGAPSVSIWDHLGAAGKISSFNPNSNNYGGETGGVQQVTTKGLTMNRASGSSASQIGAFMALSSEV